MKKQLLLFLSFLFIYGCSSSSDSDNNTTSVTDADGNVYQTVTICDQTWTQSNLNVSKYRNGDVIPQIQDATMWAGTTTGAWCYYNNDSANGTIYGKLYNWYAVNDPRGLAPTGYHIPSDTEWTTLITCLGGTDVAGGKMKEAGDSHWLNNTDATNSSGFTALPGGNRAYWGVFGSVDGIPGVDGYWWSSSEFDTTDARNLVMAYGSVGAGFYNTDKNRGCSVRCVKD